MPIIVCFSYGLDADGSFGKVNETRCARATQLFKRLKIQNNGRTWIVVTARWIPNFPLQKTELGNMQRAYLEDECGVPRLRIWPSELELLLLRERNGNIISTVDEIKEALRIVAEKGIPGPLYAVSHWYHLPRVLWYGWW
ncbi:MAG: hypothetical protein G01um101470_1058, partial [Parcubacteria group bacterium Gr01-1014_70]